MVCSGFEPGAAELESLLCIQNYLFAFTFILFFSGLFAFTAIHGFRIALGSQT